VVNRSYYAAFYAVIALLQSKKKSPRTHDGALALFDKEFVRTGKVQKRYSKIIHHLFEQRLEDDYERLDNVSAGEARKAIANAQEFVDAMEPIVSG
jgi:uncharacterized protein